MSALFRRAVGVAAVTGLAVVGAQLIGVVAAYAHTNSVHGTAVCASNGTYTVNWVVSNDYTTDETATVTGHAPNGSTISETSFPIAHGATHSVTQTGVPASAGTATLSVHGLWPDNVTFDVTGSVHLDGTCGGTVPTAPQAANGGCVNNVVSSPSVTIPSQRGVTYKLDNSPTSAGRHTVPAGTHTVSAASTTLRLVGTKSWTYHLTSAPGTCATPDTAVKPVAPSVSQSVCSGGSPSTPTVTVSRTKGVSYRVTPSAPYRPGEKVTVVATTKSGYTFGTLPSSWTKTSAHRATYTLTLLHQAPTCSGVDSTGKHNTPVGSTPSSGLAATGSRTSQLLATALGLLGLGVVSLLAGRRRRTE